MKPKKYLHFFLIILVIFLFLANVKHLSNSIVLALIFCYKSLAPSLFPFLILSQIILYSNWLDGIFLSNIKHKNNNLDNCKIFLPSIILGMLCGYIVGAKNICDKSKTYNIKSSTTDAIFLSTNASCGFTIGCIGLTVLNDVGSGVFLYLSQILIAIILFLIFKDKKKLEDEFVCQNVNTSFVKIICSSIKASSESLINICSFTIVFRCASELLLLYINKAQNPIICAIVGSIFEFTSGVFSSVLIKSEYLSLFFIGFSVGFGGLCVIIQTIYLCEGLNFNKGKFIIMKVIQGILCGFSLIFYDFIKKTLY